MFNRHRIAVPFALIAVALSGLAGCAAGRVDLVRSGQVRVEPVPSKAVRMQPPSVWQKDGATVIYGTVADKGAATVPESGHVHVIVVRPDGRLVEIPARLAVLRTGGKVRRLWHATYRTELAEPLEAGSVVRVMYRNGEHRHEAACCAGPGPASYVS